MIQRLFAHWRQTDTWWSFAHLTVGLWMAPALFVPVVVATALTASLLITFLFAIPVVWLGFMGVRVLATIERSRFGALLDEPIADPVPALTAPAWWGRLWERMRSGPRWREIGYMFLQFPVHLLMGAFVLIVWCGSLALVGLPFYAGALPGGTAKFGLFEVAPGVGSIGLALVGLVVLALWAPWSTVAVARLDAAFARWLLGPRNDHELAAQVNRLSRQREAAVDSAEAERRRIERDLHDGAQQRLVTVAMTLGSAREVLERDPDAGRQLVSEAHQEVKAALQELRDLVRGIHPAILDDRGLDAALSAVVARSPVPVTLRVEVEPRPPAPVESTAYFVVTEALTNVTRHAHATRVDVTIVRAGNRLVVEVRDDGIGGADPAHGTGLAGLVERVEAIGGWMHVVSPEGGPTTVLVELPCES